YLAFLTRYIGLFLIPGAITVLLYRKFSKRASLSALRTMPALALFVAAVIVYLAAIRAHSGFATGIERVPAPESVAALSIALLREVLLNAGSVLLLNDRFQILAAGIGLAIAIFGVWLSGRGPWIDSSRARETRPGVYLAFAAAYLLALFALRSLYI